MSKFMLNWAAAAAAGPVIAGGKGWNLGRLSRYGFPVPMGGVLAAKAYRQFMAMPEFEPLLAPLAGVSAESAADPAVADALSALQSAIRRAELPDQIIGQVHTFLTDAGLADLPVAVRSSATAEDGAASSFAGIHESFLGRRGPDEILDAVKACYASLWTPRAVAYRRRLGLADSEVACAVVICAMVTAPGSVSPRCAGVAFSADPMSGRRDLGLISAAPGSGEQVVGGSVIPEEITVTTREGRRAVTARKGRPDQVLSDGEALALSQLVRRIEWALGDGQDPQDVEWAHDGSRFWVVQARPITRLPRWTFQPVIGLPVIWSNGNSKDAVPIVLTTLSWDVLQELLRHLFFAPTAMTGFQVPPGLEIARRFGGRLYFDMTSHLWAGYDALGLLPKQMNEVTGGYQPEIPVPPGDPMHGPAGWARLRRRLRLMQIGLPFQKRLPGEIDRYIAKARELRALDLSRLPDAELLPILNQARQASLAFGPRFHLANAVFGMWHKTLHDLVGRFAPGREIALTAGLMAAGGGVPSAEHGYRVFDLAAAAERDPAALAYLQTQPLDPTGWRDLPPDSPFRQELARYMESFGHRTVYEAELATPRWREDPTYLLEQVRALLAAGLSSRPNHTAQATRQAAEAEVARAPFFLRPVVRWVAARARLASGQREAAKSAVAAICEPLRTVALATGRRMAERGALEQAGDVFHLALADVEQYLSGRWDGAGARPLVADRKAALAAWEQERPADCFILDADGNPADLPGFLPGSPPESQAVPGDGALTGIGVAAGRASGKARVIRHPSEGHLLRQGEVLVAPSTDPSWTPLFLRASAVVMEVGGYLSHGAIVAREYGIPAVVNIPGLLNAVSDGQVLNVDGDLGRVAIASD